MLLRLLTAAVGIPLFLGALWEGGWIWAALVMALALLSLGEWQRGLQQAGRPFFPLFAYSGTLGGLLGLAWLPEAAKGEAGFAALWLILVGTLLAAMFHYPQRSAVEAAGGTLVGTLYPAVGFAAFLLLRDLSGPELVPWRGHSPLPAGLRWFLLPLLCTWSVDTMAYLVGRRWGREPLAPSISPHKTWEGALAGLATGLLAGLLIGLWLRFPGWQGLTVGGICGLLGQLGDLALSALKRDLGLKDFSALLPGHGGILDRFDSLLANVPAVYLLAILWR